MRQVFPIFLIASITSLSTAGENVVKVPLDLGPSIPVINGDDGLDVDTVLLKRGLASPFIAMANNLKGNPGQGYSFLLGLGTPPQNVSVLIDTGSANFAVAGSKVEGLSTYFKVADSSSYESLGRNVFVPYTLGSWSGPLGSDVVHIEFMPSDKQNFRADVTPIMKSSDFFIPGATWQGIVGLAFEEIARPTNDPAVPFFASLVKETGTKDVFSTQLCGSAKIILKRKELLDSGGLAEAIRTADEQLRVKTYGTFDIGGIDTSLLVGPVLYTPLHKKWYYEVIITRMTVNGQDVMTDCKEYNFDKTIVDTGTTDIRLPKRVFASLSNLLMKAVASTPAGEVADAGFFQGTRMICVDVGSMALYDSFPVINFDLAHDKQNVIHLTLSPQQYLRFVGFNTAMGRDCFKFGVIPSKLSSVLGAVFLEGFYVVFDREKLRVGFAQSTCNFYGATVANSTVTGPGKYGGTGTTLDCAYNEATAQNLVLIEAVSIALGILCLLIFIPIVILLHRVTKSQSQKGETENKSDRSQLIDK